MNRCYHKSNNEKRRKVKSKFDNFVKKRRRKRRKKRRKRRKKRKLRKSNGSTCGKQTFCLLFA